jgi:hypothetical protein
MNLRIIFQIVMLHIFTRRFATACQATSMWNLDSVVSVGAEKHPNNIQTRIQYGTAGFRTK